ncbi:MAG TPA: hypothetical protein VMV56_05995 [Williamwhitmania sp.]|nr:hypothetical protein [Williamwhitmania sp.]
MRTLDSIKSTMSKKGYRFFDGGDYNMNIIGVRSTNRRPEYFDDEFYLIYRDEEGRLNQHCFSGSTDPGIDSLKDPISSKGCAILMPGQYLGLWSLGFHKGQYEALVQVKPCKVFRDGNKDDVLDFYPTSVEQGIFGINFHHANAALASLRVGRWSAGCQVVQDPKEFLFAIELFKKSAAAYGNSFSYTLLEENDFL